MVVRVKRHLAIQVDRFNRAIAANAVIGEDMRLGKQRNYGHRNKANFYLTAEQLARAFGRNIAGKL